MGVANEEIVYSCDGMENRGFFAWDEENPKDRPGIMVVHEWWGINDYIRQRCGMLAGLGYCALAIDMYGGGYVAENPDEAGMVMNDVLGDMQGATSRLKAGYETLLAQDPVDTKRTAAIGYCFGGAMVLHMARIGMPLDAAVSFHGALGSFHTPQAGEVRARILVCHGEEDAMVTMDDVAAFKAEMENAGADHEVMVLAGAQHGFTSREADENGRKYGLPLGYSGSADKASWQAMLNLFSGVWPSG